VLQGKEYGIGRPYLDKDPPHIAPIDGKEYANNLGVNAGDEICAAALRTFFVEIGAAGGVKEYSWEWRKTSEQRPAHYQVWAYGLRVHQRPPPERPG
jgi:hypothetical protein